MISYSARVTITHFVLWFEFFFSWLCASSCGVNSMPIEVSEEDVPFFAEVTAGGRITIPEEIRKIFEIKDGDAVFCKLKLVKKKQA